jgi:hypothetical protein
MRRLWPLAKESADVPDPWFRDAARMVLTALAGFIVSAQFVSLEALEIPYYVTLVGAGTLRLLSLPQFLADSDQSDAEDDGPADGADDDGSRDCADDAAMATTLTV